MEKSDILKYFLKAGVQVSAEALDVLYTDLIILERIKQLQKKDLPLVITKDFINKLSTGVVKVVKKGRQNLNISVEDFVSYNNFKYNFIKQLISSRLENLISINKISPKLDSFSLIAVVNEVAPHIITLEDNTGTQEFKIGTELSRYLVSGEIVGVSCGQKEGLEVNQVVHPGVEIRRDVKKTTVAASILIIPNIAHLDIHSVKKLTEYMEKGENLTTFVFVDKLKMEQMALLKNLPNVTVFQKQQEYFNETANYSYPTLLELNGVSILIISGDVFAPYQKQWGLDLEKTVATLLKKRDLNPLIRHPESIYFMDVVPDIILIENSDDIEFIYKGVTVISTNPSKPITWFVDLQKRETFKIDLS